jgi:hypothetical protein
MVGHEMFNEGEMIEYKEHPLLKKDVQELIELAISTSNKQTLEILSYHISLNVRGCVAKNKFTSISVLNKLAYDPVLNVSYRAVNNTNCTVNREFKDIDNKCVKCTISEKDYYYECRKCV